jgi:hypothetical protein
MNDLSGQPQSDVTGQNTPPRGQSVTSSVNKEVEGGSIDRQDALKDASGQEYEIPKEVASAGVRIHPTTVPIPPRVTNLGVKPAGQNIPNQTVSTVVLPLTDDQIASGLHEGLSSSWRWFSEWCLRRMKQLHVVVKIVHGKLVRV